MKTGLVIFNGIRFPYYLVDHAIGWAAKNEGGLHGLFIHSNDEPSDGYIFPSDIDSAEETDNQEEVEKSNANIIHSRMKLFSDLTKGKNISSQVEEFIDPSLDELLELTEYAQMLFMDALYDKSYLLHTDSFDLSDLMKKSRCPVELVYDAR